LDESMEASASMASAFGMRVFDAGEFHVGFGIAAPSDDETTEFTVESGTRHGRTPFRHSLAVTLYGDSLRALAPNSEDAVTLISALIESEAGERNLAGTTAKQRSVRTRKAKSAGK
jgi:hypothetical protein